MYMEFKHKILDLIDNNVIHVDGMNDGGNYLVAPLKKFGNFMLIIFHYIHNLTILNTNWYSCILLIL